MDSAYGMIRTLPGDHDPGLGDGAAQVMHILGGV